MPSLGLLARLLSSFGFSYHIFFNKFRNQVKVRLEAKLILINVGEFLWIKIEIDDCLGHRLICSKHAWWAKRNSNHGLFKEINELSGCKVRRDEILATCFGASINDLVLVKSSATIFFKNLVIKSLLVLLVFVGVPQPPRVCKRSCLIKRLICWRRHPQARQNHHNV